MNETFIGLKTILSGATGVVVGCTSLLAAMVSLLKLWRALRKQLVDFKPQSQKRQRNVKIVIEIGLNHLVKSGSFFSFLVSAALFSIVLVVSLWPTAPSQLVYTAITPTQQTQTFINQVVTTRAWLAFERGETNYFANGKTDRDAFMRAITNADFVINSYSGMASNQQQVLLKTNAPVPANGRVSDQQRTNILEQGLINDVGTCYFIKGRALEYLGQIDQARAVYQIGTNYPFARTWDSRGGFFWSPTEAALGRLAQMPRQ
jgi:hypothetical protein